MYLDLKKRGIVEEICDYCSGAFQVKEDLSKSQAALLNKSYRGHPSIVTWVEQGSKHDFSVQAWNVSGEICRPYHTPHNANTTPLWDHQITTASYILYSSASLIGTPAQPRLTALSLLP